ncbi:MAG TPA: hypothetical protein VIP10_00250, partial [Burkholderiaceae bacterium]
MFDARSLPTLPASTTVFGSRAWVARSLVLLFACYVGGRIGLAIPRSDPNFALVWPPAGIALAAMVRLGVGVWPAVAL